MPIASLQIHDLRKAYLSGTLHPREVVAECYRRIAASKMPEAWISVVPEKEALQAAERLPEDKALPLWGIPFAVKDNIDVASMETTAGCPAFAYTPGETATVVRRLVEAGAILIGKTNMDQFATGLVGVRSPYGECSSVYHSDYVSGGSSSGSAVAVALDLVSFALGTDTAGSGRVPAAFNHLVGYKPTRGYLSCSGVVPACRSLDCVSIFAKDVAGTRVVAEVAGGYDNKDPFSRRRQARSAPDPKRKFGVPIPAQREFFGDDAAAALFDRAVGSLAWTGWEPVELDVQPFLDAALLLYQGPWVAERLEATRTLLEKSPEAVHPVVRQILEGARRWTALDAYHAMAVLERIRKKTEHVWEEWIDFLVLPTTGTIYTREAVRQEPITLNSNLGRYTNFVNLMDLCAVAVPAGFRPDGLPFGIQLIGPAWHDYTLLRIAEEWLQAREAMISLAVVGAHLRGQPLHWQIEECGGLFEEQTTTAARYRLYELPGATPRKPGLARVDNGSEIEVEVYSLPAEGMGRFLKMVPPPLCIGSVTLKSGRLVKGFLCETAALEGALEVSQYGGWRKWLETR